LTDSLLLAIAAEQEEELSLKGEGHAVAIEVAEEGVLLEGLQYQLGLELRLEHPSQRGLPHTDRSFDD
jgi:hypothetical protein